MLRIEYQLTEADLLQFYLYYAAHSDVHRRARRRHRLFVPVAYIVLALITWWCTAFAFAIFLVVLAVIWYCLSPIWLRYRYRRFYAKSIAENVGDSLSKPSVIELRPDGIFASSYAGESTFRYYAVDRIAENAGYTYVFIGKNQALVLPHDRIPRDSLESLVSEINLRRQMIDSPQEPPS